jgi:hypothetical protein
LTDETVEVYELTEKIFMAMRFWKMPFWAWTFTEEILLVEIRLKPFILTLLTAGSKLQSDKELRLLVVAMGRPFKSRVLPPTVASSAPSTNTARL